MTNERCTCIAVTNCAALNERAEVLDLEWPHATTFLPSVGSTRGQYIRIILDLKVSLMIGTRGAVKQVGEMLEYVIYT